VTALAHHFAFEFKAGLRNATVMMMNYLFPLGFYALMGVVMTRINPLFAETMLPAMVIFAVLASALLGLPGPLVEAREAGIYRTYKINGVPAGSILGVPTMATLIHALIAGAIITATAGLFGADLPVRWGAFLAIALLTLVTFGALGALIGVVATDSRATVLWSQLVFLPSMLLGGLMMPLSLLPPSMLPISALLPPAQAMQAFLGLAYGRETVLDPTIAVLVLAATAVVAAGLAIYLFDWDSANRSRRGHPAWALLVFVPAVAGAVAAF
jgi:ABC-2 type transport system permease protein